jgi:hypothetical protein
VILLVCTSAASAAPKTLRVGTLTLHRCFVNGYGDAWCGTVMRPLDPALARGPRIPIRFTWFPAHPKAARTIVAVAGGPGGAGIASFYQYIPTFGALFNENLLLIDNRGTGTSGALSCPAFQRTGYNTNGYVPTPTAALARVVGRCGAALNRRFKAPGGGYVHASVSPAAGGDLGAAAGRLRPVHGRRVGALLRPGDLPALARTPGSAAGRSPEQPAAARLDSDPGARWRPRFGHVGRGRPLVYARARRQRQVCRPAQRHPRHVCRWQREPGRRRRCADSIITRFVDRPAALHSINVSCAARIPPIQTVTAYPRTFAAAPAATVVSGQASLTATPPGSPRRRPATRRSSPTTSSASMSDSAEAR